MREIKFKRAHFKSDGSFLYFSEWGVYSDMFKSPSTSSEEDRRKATDLQYTGLKDKNGKEIYEGDVLKSPADKYYVIEYDLGCFHARGFGCGLPTYLFEQCQILGNIYEQPNILTQN